MILGCGHEMFDGYTIEEKWVEAVGLQRRFALDWTTNNTAAYFLECSNMYPLPGITDIVFKARRTLNVRSACRLPTLINSVSNLQNQITIISKRNEREHEDFEKRKHLSDRRGTVKNYTEEYKAV